MNRANRASSTQRNHKSNTMYYALNYFALPFFSAFGGLLKRGAILILPAIAATSCVFAGTPANLTFLSAAQTIPVGQCSTAVRVGTTDASGQAANVAVNTRIYFTGSNTSLTFYTDSGCSTPTTNGVVVQAGTS